MSPRTSRWAARLTAVAGAIALAALGAVVAAAPASADTAPPVANINPATSGSIVVHKYSEPTGGGGTPNAGGETTTVPAGASALTGVTFDVAQVQGIDLTTNAGWATAQALTINSSGQVVDGSTPYTLAAATSQVTDGTGTATFGNLPLGVYLVTEGADTGHNNILAKAVPFLVTVPMPDNGQWNYTVNAYPKNVVQGTPVMAVDDSGAHTIGDSVTWTVTSTVPTLNTGGSFGSFVVTNALDSRLTYVSAAVTVGGVAVPSADYTITAPSTTNSDTLTVTFTAAGLADLATNYQGKSLAVAVDTTVNAIGNGTISDSATVNGIAANPVDTLWGNLIVAADGGSAGHPLEGATVQLYLPGGDPSCATPGAAVGTAQTSDATGVATWPGLKAGSYCVKQVSAPAGWDPDTTVHTATVAVGASTTAGATVISTQVAAFTLPMTGAAGTVTFTLVGLALLAGGLGLVLITRRRANARRAQQI